MDNFWKGFEKVSAKKWRPSRLLDNLRQGISTKIKNFSIKGLHQTKAGKKL